MINKSSICMCYQGGSYRPRHPRELLSLPKHRARRCTEGLKATETRSILILDYLLTSEEEGHKGMLLPVHIFQTSYYYNKAGNSLSLWKCTIMYLRMKYTLMCTISHYTIILAEILGGCEMDEVKVALIIADEKVALSLGRRRKNVI